MDNVNTNELIIKIYTEMQTGFKRIDARFEQIEARFEQIEARFEQIEGRLSRVESEFVSVKSELKRVQETVSRIEINHGQKLAALLDGFTQLSQKVDRIEAEVKKHDEFILKRIK